MGEVMGLKIALDRLDFIEFGGVFWQPLDGEPVCAGGQDGERAFAGVDRTIVLDQHDRLGLSPGLRSKETLSRHAIHFANRRRQPTVKTYPLVSQTESA